MALDMADALANNGDILLVVSDKYRAYNLLRDEGVFCDNPGIGIDLSDMVNTGISDRVLESLIIQYLSDFRCDLRDVRIVSDRGNISLDFNFGGSFVHT